MPTYRVYELSNDGHIERVPRVLESPDDESAMREARQWLDGHALEVWEKARMIGRIEPT